MKLSSKNQQALGNMAMGYPVQSELVHELSKLGLAVDGKLTRLGWEMSSLLCSAARHRAAMDSHQGEARAFYECLAVQCEREAIQL